jgi:predicted TIM-barrel enzyme
VDLPVLIGSGVTSENLNPSIQASGLIIGSYFKEGGHWSGPVDLSRVKSFMAKVERLRV